MKRPVVVISLICLLLLSLNSFSQTNLDGELLQAVTKNDQSKVDSLLQKGADVNSRYDK